jgi:ferrous iron transport protein B
MWFIYWVSISTLGDYFIGWIESLFEWIGGGVQVALEGAGASEWITSLIVDGIIGGVGGVLVFVPQLMILFFFISLLEDCGYMARVAFIMDRIFRRFGLSGKSFIPMLVGTGCSIPGIMASRTIENEKDRKMTVMLTPFIPCGAKLPVFAMFIAMLFSEQSWVGPMMYILGISMVIISGIILKRTKLFKGDPAPFVMELPQYRLPRAKGTLIHMWEKGKSFMIKAGTIILAAAVGIWFLQSFNFSLHYIGGENIENSILAGFGRVFRYIFIPLGFGDSWAGGVASITGMVAKEVVVTTFSIVGSSIDVVFSQVTAFSFMVFTLFAAPCFAAIGAMKREFGSWKWTFIAISYQTGVAYVVALIINQVGSIIFRNTSAMAPVVLDPSTVSYTHLTLPTTPYV